MPRNRYPSDEKRTKQRPHVKIHLSARNHRKTVGHFDGAAFRGQFLGLFMIAAERFAAREGGRVHLSRADVEFISGKHRRDVALKAVQHLLDVLEYSHELRGDVVVTTLPKLADKQYYGSALRTKPPAIPEDSAERQGTKDKEQVVTPPPAGGDVPPESRDVSGFLNMISKGAVPVGLGGQTWETRAAWFEHHREIMCAEAEKNARKDALEVTGSTDGWEEFFNPSFRSVLMRYWKNKRPKQRAATPAKTPGVGVWDSETEDQEPNS